MIVIEKNEGPKIPYTVKGNKITFDDDLTINLEKREEDGDVNIDICYDSNKALVIGSAVGREYVAQIHIPARQYDEAELMDVSEDEPKAVEPIPFDIKKVTLALWAIA